MAHIEQHEDNCFSDANPSQIVVIRHAERAEPAKLSTEEDVLS